MLQFRQKTGQRQIRQRIHSPIEENGFASRNKNNKQKTIKIILNVITASFLNKTPNIHETPKYLTNVWLFS